MSASSQSSPCHLDHHNGKRSTSPAQEQRPDGTSAHHQERQRRLLDPQIVAGWEADIATSLREMEEAVLFQLCDLLILANYDGIYSVADVTERAIKLLKPVARHCRSASIARERLVEAHGMLKYMGKERSPEEHYTASPRVVDGRITDRQEYMRHSLLFDLDLGRRYLAEARALRLEREQAERRHEPMMAA